jgi:hypothetical protein
VRPQPHHRSGIGLSTPEPQLPAGVGGGGAHRQVGAQAVADHGDRSGGGLGPGGEEAEAGVRVAQDALLFLPGSSLIQRSLH